MGYLRLRQLCLVARDLEPALGDLAAVLGLAVCHRDGNVAKYGLVNGLLPIGTNFLEVVAPTTGGTAAGRYLERRGGEGGYMVIVDCDDLERRRGHVQKIGVRIANALSYETYTGIQLHPRDTGGCMFEFNHTAGGEREDGPYHPAGPHWQAAIRTAVTARLLGAEIQGENPAGISETWSRVIERPATRMAEDAWQIALDTGYIRFVAARDGRGEGLGGIDIAAADRGAILAAAARRGLASTADGVMICGTRFRLLPA